MKTERNASLGTGPAITLSEFVERDYWPAKQGLSQTTLRGYRGDLKRVVLPALGEKPIAEIGHREIQAMLNTAPSRKAAKHARGTLSSVLSLAVELDAVEANAALGRFTLPAAAPKEEHPLGTWLTGWDEINRILDAAHEYDPGGEIERICIAGLGFGLRKGEILGLDGEDFDLEGRVLHVRRNFTRWKESAAIHDLKTRESRRDIPILAPIAERLERLHIQPGPFVTYNGARSNPSTAAKHFATFRDRMQLPGVTMASMRHSFATAALHSGMDVKNVQAWLGHTDASTTLRNYAHSNLSTLQAAAVELDEKLCGTMRSEGATGASCDASRAAMRAPAAYIPIGVPDGDGLADSGAMPAADPLCALCESLKRSDELPRRMMGCMLERPDITREELACALGLSLSTCKRRLADLQGEGLIARVGGKRDGMWAVFPALLGKSNRYCPAA